ncbi:hypothetical protein KIN20_022083 [Parelaphostrongylus tenuis]|uniref:non-specific serine/threonine protein kinase n=1 Tax=Parelaphostrongylus tenuis TaxID=148309 RepID=A0AAD5N8L6_PARTN|nr:hypothetical protein KIN20_022083 [Parelaphostrongylus tenuis]
MTRQSWQPSRGKISRIGLIGSKTLLISVCEKRRKERPNTGDLLNHAFITRSNHNGVIQELITRTKAIVLELDNFQYKKMRKLMYLDEVDNKEGENLQGEVCEEVDDLVTDCGISSVEKGGSTSSKSGSLRSLTSFPFYAKQPVVVIVIAVDHRFQTTSDQTVRRERIALAYRLEMCRLKIPRNIKDDMATLKKSKFSTLRSAKLISREQEEYNKENNMYEQMNGYKRLRQMHHKEIQQLEERCASDIELLRLRLDKELDQLVSGYAKAKKKLRKQVLSRQAHEMRCFSNAQLKDYRHSKEMAKNSLKERGLTRSAYEVALKDIKAQLTKQRTNAEAAFEAKLRAELESEVMKYRRSQLLMLHSTEKRLDEEDLNVLERQMDNRQAMLLRHHEATRDIEVAQLKEIQTMKKRHQIIQHDAESTNQTEYTKRKSDDLRKRHAIQSRQQPRELKLKEAQIRKQFRQAVKTQARQFKLYQTQLMQATPKEEHKEISIQLKEKQKRRIALLTSQYEYQIESMVQEKTGKLESWQEEEARSLHERLAKELDELKEYQAKQRAQLENTIDKELTALDERIALRRAMLEQRFKEEREDMQKQRESHSRLIAERHAAEELQLTDAVSNSSHTTAL